MRAWIKAFHDTYKARTGRRPVSYTSTSWWRCCVGGGHGFGKTVPLWVARYSINVGARLEPLHLLAVQQRPDRPEHIQRQPRATTSPRQRPVITQRPQAADPSSELRRSTQPRASAAGSTSRPKPPPTGPAPESVWHDCRHTGARRGNRASGSCRAGSNGEAEGG